jgi:hypothetical protein
MGHVVYLPVGNAALNRFSGQCHELDTTDILADSNVDSVKFAPAPTQRLARAGRPCAFDLPPRLGAALDLIRLRE